jgi:6-phosphogluconolactonase
VPSAFGLDPDGKFLFAGGTASGRLATYRIDGASGALTSLGAQDIGKRPAAIFALSLGA